MKYSEVKLNATSIDNSFLLPILSFVKLSRRRMFLCEENYCGKG